MSSIEVYCVWQRAHDSLLSRDCKASMAKSNIHVKINISKKKTLKYRPWLSHKVMADWLIYIYINSYNILNRLLDSLVV